jgi:hypothetical protein
MATLVNLNINAFDIIGDTFDPRRAAAYLATNTPDGLIVVDGTTIRLGDRRIKFDSGLKGDDLGSVVFSGLVATNSADNPTSFAYKVTIVYTPIGSREQKSWTSSEFPLTASANLASISEAFDGLAIAPTWQSEHMAAAQALLDQQEAIAGLTGEDAAIANRVNTPGSATDLALKAAYVTAGSAFLDLGKQAGVDPTGVADSTAALQTALNSASSFGVRAFARGTVKTSSLITINGDADLSGLTINYTGTGTAVRLGASSVASFRKTIALGPVVAANKTALGWGQVVGSIGVEIRNAYNYEVRLTQVKNFETGLLMYGSNSLGTSYCNIHLGHLDNNKVNLRIGADDTTSGYCNQNTFYGGRYGHNSNEGPNASGTKHILIDNLSVNADPNNNIWINPSIESPTVVEYAIDAQGGAYNQWFNPRLEFTSGNTKIRWGAGAVRNLVIGGNQMDSVVEEWVTGATLNSVFASNFHRLMSSGEGGGLVLENNASNSSPALSIMRANGVRLGDAPGTAYGTRLEYSVGRWKVYNDAFERCRVDGGQGRLLLGAGNAAPVAGLYGTGAFLLFTTGSTTVGFETDNAADLGGATNYRPRYVRAGTAIQTAAVATGSRPAAAIARAGAMVFDTTLGKPIWSNGTNWVDATGAVV